MRIRIEAGTDGDLRALERFHYAPGRPANPDRVLRAHRGGVLVGVLVTAWPSLNAGWRNTAWPGVFVSGDRRRDAARVNAELRTIARVIIEPRFRGLGCAARLVRSYLADPATRRTEAVAAMGAVCPFFERAGMRAIACEPHAADRKLSAVLAGLGLEARGLLDPAVRARACATDGFEAALMRWARARGKAVATREPGEIAIEAAMRLTARPVAYAHERRPWNRAQGDAA